MVKRDTSKKRNSILDAATAVFIDQGYEKTSMDRIADRAGASKRTVYNHFTSKEVLFQATLQRVMTEGKALKQIPYRPNVTLETQLGRFVEAKCAFANNSTWAGMLKVTAGVFITHPQLASETVANIEAEEDSLVTWLEAARLDGRLRFVDVRLTATAFWSAVSGAFFWPILYSHGAVDSSARAEDLKKEIIAMFLARYGA